jgi:hypothetical protein
MRRSSAAAAIPSEPKTRRQDEPIARIEVRLTGVIVYQRMKVCPFETGVWIGIPASSAAAACPPGLTGGVCA